VTHIKKALDGTQGAQRLFFLKAMAALERPPLQHCIAYISRRESALATVG